MTKNEFLQRFNLKSLDDASHQYNHKGHLKNAAVLVLLHEQQIKNSQQLEILLTKRAIHLRHHAGQICFPGGKAEPSDTSYIATALRESYEEIGLQSKNVDVIGQLHPYQTVSGYIITPIIAFLKVEQTYTIDENEVSEILHVPLEHFLQQQNHFELTTRQNNVSHQVHFMPYQNHNIWGATAAMIKDLITHLT